MPLGVNIDHVATLRQARYATMLDSHNGEPDIVAAALAAQAGGADSIRSMCAKTAAICRMPLPLPCAVR